MKMRLPQVFKTKEVLKRFLDLRDEACGHRLGAFKKNGGLTDAAAINSYKCGSYNLVFKDKILSEVAHNPSGARAEVPPLTRR